MVNISHNPTEQNKKTVETMTVCGVPQEEIAKILGIDPKTLRLHYRKELDESQIKANTNIAKRLYEKALTGDNASMFFWLKTRARWKEAIDINHGGQKDNPVVVMDVSGLSDATINELMAARASSNKTE